MNAVIFYSNTGQSKSVAEYFANNLKFPLIDIESNKEKIYDSVVLVFPVHCQNIPYLVREFLKGTKIKYLTAIATYGKSCCGNALYEINKDYKNVIAGAYVPTKHSYIDGDTEFRDFDKLTQIVEKIKNPYFINLPKIYKNPLANCFPQLRSRLGISIYKNSNCSDCGRCTVLCPFLGIKSGKTNNGCIRCLKCVQMCPNHALSVKVRLPLRLYLRKRKKDLIIYV